jgi:hypothetical protein
MEPLGPSAPVARSASAYEAAEDIQFQLPMDACSPSSIEDKSQPTENRVTLDIRSRRADRASIIYDPNSTSRTDLPLEPSTVDECVDTPRRDNGQDSEQLFRPGRPYKRPLF